MNFDIAKNKINSFTGGVPMNKEEMLNAMSDEEKISMFTKNAAKLLAKKAEYEVPENGAYSRKCTVSFDIPGTQNIAYYVIEHDVLEPKNQRRFSIGAIREGSDRITSAQLKKGTKKEILDFLCNENNAKLFKDTLMDVSKTTDKYFL